MAKTLNAQPEFDTFPDALPTISLVNPGIIVDKAVVPLLNSRKALVDHLTNLITQERIRYNIPQHSMEIGLHVDSETGRKLIHIKQTVATDAQTALEYWDKVGIPVDQWISALPQTQADIVRDEILLTIHWKPNVSGQ